LDAPASSLPKHNSSIQLPSELSAKLLSAPSTGSVAAVWPHFSTHSTMAPTLFFPVAPAPSPSEFGHETRSSPSAASRPAQWRTPSLAARVATADTQVCAQAALLQPSGSHFQTCWFLYLPLRHCHKMVPEPFSYPAMRFCKPGTVGAFTASTDAVPVLSTGTAKEVGPLFSSPSRPEFGGSPLESCLCPCDGQTSPEYPSNPVQYLYISCFVTANKPVLLYLLLRLLPQWTVFKRPPSVQQAPSLCK
jgi:hypothetical protein